MNGELAQVIALATYGTAWLHGAGDDAPPDLAARGNSTFKFVRSVEFEQGGSVAGPADWLRGLRDGGVRRLWLSVPDPPERRSHWPYLAAHIEAGFSNGGGWRLLADFDGRTAAWRPWWEVGDLKAPDRRIWSVRYTRDDAAGPVRRPALGEAKSTLDATLVAARGFAARTDNAMWAETFDGALTATGTDYQADMVSPDYPDEARTLAAQASRGWVFGGMGSWNDLGLADGALKAEYEEVSRNLYRAILVACVAATNCELPDVRSRQ